MCSRVVVYRTPLTCTTESARCLLCISDGTVQITCSQHCLRTVISTLLPHVAAFADNRVQASMSQSSTRRQTHSSSASSLSRHTARPAATSSLASLATMSRMRTVSPSPWRTTCHSMSPKPQMSAPHRWTTWRPWTVHMTCRTALRLLPTHWEDCLHRSYLRSFQLSVRLAATPPGRSRIRNCTMMTYIALTGQFMDMTDLNLYFVSKPMARHCSVL